MRAIKEIIKLPERRPEESAAIQADLKTPPKSLTEVQAAIRAGRSTLANSLMNTPAIYQRKGLPNTKQAERALQVLQAGKSLFFTGIPGSGKTHLAIALMNEFFAANMQDGEKGPTYTGRGYPMFLPAVELLLEIKEFWHNEESAQAESEKRILDKYAGKPLLVLDDLGAEKISEWSRQVVYLLIDRRYRNTMQTIITSNLSHKTLADQLDARIASRVSEMGAIIEMPANDWRVRRN